MKKIILSLLTIYLFIPISVFAYSDYIIASGETIAVELKSDYILVVGSYKIKNYDVLKDTDLKIGDKITKINNNKVSSIKEMLKIVENLKEEKVNLTYIRNNKEYTETINIYKENGEYKTGLYVKDTIRGVATLTYIDKQDETIKFGALGHGIVNWRSTDNTRYRIQIK